MWWPETGSNRRRRPFQGRALPLSYLALALKQNASFGDRQERPGVRLLHQPFQGSLPPAGRRQLKRKSSIATPSHSLQLRHRVILAPTTPLIEGRQMHRPALRLTAALLVCLTPYAEAQTSAKSARINATSQEQRAIHAFDVAKKSPIELNAFLVNMPKGGDLHMHLSGAVYAETFIR